VLFLCASLLTASSLVAATRPNILLILCDDLGFGDIGPTFQNQRAARRDRSVPSFTTERLDAFANQGMILRNHYCGAPVCAPSRASLLLGVTQGHANVRDNQFDKALADNHTLGTVLRQAGYATAAIGKWGLQGRADGKPNRPGEKKRESQGGNPILWPAYPTKRGFDFYFGYVRHRDGHFHYPKEDGKEVWENDREVSAGLDLCYTADLFAERAKKWIVDQHSAAPQQPFFLYLALDTPHAKLQYPPCAYPDGGGLTGGLQWTGQPGHMLNTARGTVDGWCDPAAVKASWDDDHNPATPEVAWPEVQKRYVTDVRRIDRIVGDLVQLLGDLAIDKNTLVVFTSDNGPSRESYLPEAYKPNFFNGFGPFDGIKRDTLEGGLREPTLVRWPGHVPAGRVSHTPCGMWDWLATFAEVAGLPALAASDGVSLVPTLTGQGKQRPSNLYVEYFQRGKTPDYPQFDSTHRGRRRNQMQVVQLDGYTGLRYDIQSADDDFEIYDVEHDPGQARNLAGGPARTRAPEIANLAARMKARVLQVRRPNPSAPRPYDSTPLPAQSPGSLRKGQLRCDVYQGRWPWIPDFRTLKPANSQSVATIDLQHVASGNNVGAAFNGYFHAEQTGLYTFSVASDGGTELFLHDARVIDDDFKRDSKPAGNTVSGTIRLAAGWHPLRLYYHHTEGPGKLVCQFSRPEGARRPIPARLLATPW